ncbi:MAG: hypothetical protein AMXMBFR13_37700 [Phycisphaerae bacterium]
MSAQRIRFTNVTRSAGTTTTWTVLALAVCLAVAVQTHAQRSEPPDPVDIALQFIDQTAEATDLFNVDRPQEALAIFQELKATADAHPELNLDEDGYVAFSIGDCLAVMDQNDAARAAYLTAAATHASMQSRVAERLAELDLDGPVSEETIVRFRTAAQSPDQGGLSARWRLARALQARARDLLTEAVQVLRLAKEAQPAGLQPCPSPSWLESHAAVLEELGRDLALLIEQSEARWGSLRSAARETAEATDTPTTGPFSERMSAEHRLRTKDGKHLNIQIHRESEGGSTQLIVNGKPLELTPTQRRLVQRHQDRINAILMDAANRTAVP